jgi:hypothetical protein
MLNLLNTVTDHSNTLIPDWPKVQAALSLWAQNFALPAMLQGGVDTGQIVWRDYDGVGRNTRG